MTLSRASVNCRECYEARKRYDITSLDVRGYVNSTRNEAMKALEPEAGFWKQLLDLCANCDYSEPRISKEFEERLAELCGRNKK
jgi:hypothetical protein